MREAVGPGAATRSRFRVPYVPTPGSGLAYIGPMQQAYRQLLRTFGRGWERGAVDEIASVFASDAVFRETPFTEPSTGLEAIRAYWRDVPANYFFNDTTTTEIYTAGPWFATEF